LRLELGFRAFDPHELLAHVLAVRLGLYRDEGVQVELRDLTFGPADAVQVSCGSALLARLRGGQLTVHLVAARAPLFWLVGRAPLPATGGRVASYPDGSPAALFAATLLPRARLMPARDDAARIGLVLAGDADGAVVSSAEPESRLAEHGLVRLRAFAEEVSVPTTGLAVPQPLAADEAVAAAVRAQRGALAALHARPDDVEATLIETFRYDRVSAERAVRELATWFTAGGRIDRGTAERAIAFAAAALGVPPLPVEDVYAAGALAR
jgi:hypothetical protein